MPDPQQTEPTSRFPSVPVASTMPGWYPALLASVSGHVTTGPAGPWPLPTPSCWRATGPSAARFSTISTSRATRPRSSTGCPPTSRTGSRRPAATRRATSSTCARSRRPGRTAWLCKAGLHNFPWYHYIALLEKLDTAELRQWYAAAALEGGWTTAVTHVLARRAGVQPAQHRRDRGRAGDDPARWSLLIFPGW